MLPASESSYQNAPTGEQAGLTETPSSSALSAAISTAKLTGILATADDLESWTPGSTDDASAAVASVGAYCRDYCPVRTACVEGACRLYRLEGRALDALGYHRDADTEAVGVVGQPTTGLGL